MRDVLSAKPRSYLNTLQFFHSSWDESLPYTMTDVETNATHVTAKFEHFASDMNNWYVDPGMFDVMPEMRGHCNVWQGGKMQARTAAAAA